MRPPELRREDCSTVGWIELQWQDIIGRAKRDIATALSAIESEHADMGLAVNENKTKYMLLTSIDMQRIRFLITVRNYAFGSSLFILVLPLSTKIMSA